LVSVEQPVGLVQGIAYLLAKPVDSLAGNATCVTPPTMLRRLRQLNPLARSAGLCKRSASCARDPHHIEPLATQRAQQSGRPQRV
jgi:hypothetical protein